MSGYSDVSFCPVASELVSKTSKDTLLTSYTEPPLSEVNMAELYGEYLKRFQETINT